MGSEVYHNLKTVYAARPATHAVLCPRPPAPRCRVAPPWHSVGLGRMATAQCGQALSRTSP